MLNDLLTGNLIRLRALEPADVDLLYQWENDTSVWKLSNTLAPFSRFQLEEFVINGASDIFASRQLRLMIDQISGQEQPEAVGTVDLFDFDPYHHRAGIGILIRKQHRQKGFASEAIQLLTQYSFETLCLHQLFCNISQDNTASIKLFEKHGFIRCGIKKDWNYNNQRWDDECMYQLINPADKL